MSSDDQVLVWSSSFTVAPLSRTPKLTGDKILLPQSALEQLLAAAPIVNSDAGSIRPLTSAYDPYNPYTYAAERAARAITQDRQQDLPHPLTFRLVNPQTGRIVYAGIREFSAEDGEVAVSPALREALGVQAQASKSQGDDVQEESATITVHARTVPKGSFVKLRPLESGYNPEDWKALLEQHLRANYTTLTNGEVLTVPGARSSGGKREEFRFLVDGFQPEGDAICIVDTDLEVDIEALNEEQARETLKKITDKAQKQSIAGGSSEGGEVSLFKAIEGQVLNGEYVDFELQSWDRSQGVEIKLSGLEESADLELYVSPFAPRQRSRPREDEYVFAGTGRQDKSVLIPARNVELDDAEAIWISVSVPSSESPSAHSFTLIVSPPDVSSKPKTNGNPTDDKAQKLAAGEVQCGNCLQWVPQRTLMLHENFCLRNNVLCPEGCGQVFQKRSDAFSTHWHCPHDTFWGNTPASQQNHDHRYHTERTCPGCDRVFPSLPLLAAHRTTNCPAKLILCQFCHLEVPQEGDPDEINSEAILSGLTPHELADGARTTECHLCGKIVRLRDMRVHLASHEMEKTSRPEPRVCRNIICGRTLDGVNKTGDTRAGTRMGNGPGNDMSLCSTCFGPLYVALHDPEGRALKRRVERRYLMQLLTGCGKPWCRNELCKTGRENLDSNLPALNTKDALALVRPSIEESRGGETPLHFCVDEGSQKRRVLAGHLSAERDLKGRSYGFEWCVAGLEAENGDILKAREWLKNWAPAV